MSLAIYNQSVWDWIGADKAFRRALEINPGNAELQGNYAWLLVGLGRFDEAIARANRQSEMDPSQDPAGGFRVNIYMFS
jgi:Tfp pilus assembly protein PilF